MIREEEEHLHKLRQAQYDEEQRSLQYERQLREKQELLQKEKAQYERLRDDEALKQR